MQPAARKGDPTIHLGIIEEGSPNVTIGGMPAARLLDKHLCPLHGPGPITESSLTVYINGMGAARMLDKCTCMIPSTSAGDGNASKEEQAKWEISAKGEAEKEKKWGEREKEGKWGNNKDEEGKDGKEEKDDGWKPKVAVEASKELFNKNNTPQENGKDKENYAQWNAYEAKGTASAGAEMDGLKSAKVNAGAKVEAEYSVGKAVGKVGDADKGLGEYSGEAKLLTAHAEAGGEGVVEVKNGKLEAAYVEAKAGIGGSVVEGKAEGKRSFKIPFVGWKVSLGGEVSGALLTAEAEASGNFGYKKGKFSFGAGAKIGAALAGLGFKFNVTIEKDEPPEPPAKAPGVPGVAGIDPIAMGHMTTLIGNIPPPYIPGAPKPAMPGSHTDAIGIRNNPQALTLAQAKRAAAAFTPLKCAW